MATERQSPDAIVQQTNLSGVVADIQDDPDSPDGTWLTADANNADTAILASFPTPTGNPTVGVGLQEFKLWVRNTPNNSTTTWEMWLNENGTRLNGGASIATGTITNTTGQLKTATWNASLLGTANGSAVEIEFRVTAVGGAPGGRTTGEIDAVEWNVTYSPVGTTVSMDLGTFAHAGQTADVTKQTPVGMDLGTYTHTGQVADVTKNIPVDMDLGTYVHTGAAATVTRHLLIAGNLGTFAHAGQTADVTLQSLISTDLGVYTYTGQTADITLQVAVVADLGTYAHAGQTADITRQLLVSQDLGAYALSGQDVTVLRHLQVTMDSGSYAFGGLDLNINQGSVLPMNIGAFTYSGKNASITRQLSIPADGGAYALSSLDSSILRHIPIAMDSNSFTFTGLTANFSINQGIFSADAGQYVLTGFGSTVRFGRTASGVLVSKYDNRRLIGIEDLSTSKDMVAI